MKISVIICAYNMEKHIDRCLESAVSQSFSDYEIILINDGSNDLTPDKCRIWSERNERIVYISHDNMGLGASRNKGIAVARGEYVTFLDADDRISENYLANMFESSLMHDADIVLSDFIYVYDGVDGKEEKPSLIRFEEGVIDLKKESNAFGRCRTFMCGKLFRKTLFTDNDLNIPLHNYEDISLTPFLISKAQTVSYKRGGFYYYLRNRSDSIINDFSQFKFILVSLKELADRFISDESFESHHQSLMALFWGQTCHLFNLTAGNCDNDKAATINAIRSQIVELFIMLFPEGKCLISNCYYINGGEVLKKAVSHIILEPDQITEDYSKANIMITDKQLTASEEQGCRVYVTNVNPMADAESESWNLADELFGNLFKQV